jgi:hypothetical protein
VRRLGVGATAFALALAWTATATASLGNELEGLAGEQGLGTTAIVGAPYADASGDSDGLGPDLTDVTVSNDAAGTVTIAVAVPNLPKLRPGDFFALFLDTDGRPATGSLSALGADYAVAFDGTTGTTDLARWSDSGWSFSAPARTLRARWSGGATVSVHRNELGGTAGFNFWIGATWTSERGVRYGDLAPDSGTWSFALTGVDPSAGPGREPVLDEVAPKVRALWSKGRAGQILRLRYRVSDDSGESRERVRILRGRAVVAVLPTNFAENARGVTYWVSWRPPRAARGLYRFCVEAWDRSENRSTRSCASLRIRR